MINPSFVSLALFPIQKSLPLDYTMSSWNDEDDEDAFLYGNASSSSNPAAGPSGNAGGATSAKEATPSTSALPGVSGDASAVNPPISLTENGTASLVHETGNGGTAGGEEQEQEDDDDEMDESDGEDEEQQQPQAEDSDDVRASNETS